MGWSCTRAASETMEKFEDWCRSQTGFQNTYNENGVQKFVDWSRKEFQDGSVVGEVWKMNGNKPSGTIKIDPNGTIVKGPKFIIESLKKMKNKI